MRSLREEYVAKEAERKQERQKVKKSRDYEIFDSMPYKLSSKTYEMDEKHPISKMRFETSSMFL